MRSGAVKYHQIVIQKAIFLLICIVQSVSFTHFSSRISIFIRKENWPKNMPSRKQTNHMHHFYFILLSFVFFVCFFFPSVRFQLLTRKTRILLCNFIKKKQIFIAVLQLVLLPLRKLPLYLYSSFFSLCSHFHYCRAEIASSVIFSSFFYTFK